ncbi:hypothetical protein QBZ16_003763 [Prototheca wickerhamii]|uniref:Parafibromin n=1 Tax=Prototheca wickerhamii TaxID=3111 RepID=A0AAD9MKD3_PROWI|nr:hypothetical protein QBZ16_003763 [Prototheca wickerhamii]
MDPLSLLREFVSQGRLREVTTSGDRVHFGDRFSFLRDARTAYKSRAKDGAFYDLGTLLFFAQSLGPSFKFADYFKKAREAGVGQVTFVDRKDLEQYLTGQIETSQAIELLAPELDLTTPLEDRSAEPAREQAPSGAAEAEGAAEADAEELMLKRVLAGELQLRDRNSVLSAPGRSFAKVLALLKAAQSSATKLERPHASKDAAHKARPRQPKALPVAPSGRYERETAPDATLRQLGADTLGLGIDSAGAKRAAAPEARAAPRGAEPPAKKPRQPERPGIFKTVEQCRAEGVIKQDRIVIERTIGREKAVPYEVTDVEPTHRRDWDRVVAVFCSGKAWQFKKWPFRGAASGDLLDTFQRVLGVYLYFQDQTVESTVKQWKVKTYGLSRESRHRDRVVMQDILKSLDLFLESKRCTLAY